MPAAGGAIIPFCMRMQFIGAPFCIAAMPRAVACMDIGLRPEGLCVSTPRPCPLLSPTFKAVRVGRELFSDDRKLCRPFEILIREESIDVRGCLVMILVRDCFGVIRALSFSVLALELVSCDILPDAPPEDCAEVGLLVNAPESLTFGNNAKRWLSRYG